MSTTPESAPVKADLATLRDRMQAAQEARWRAEWAEDAAWDRALFSADPEAQIAWREAQIAEQQADYAYLNAEADYRTAFRQTLTAESEGK